MKADSEMYRKLLYKGGAMAGGLLLSLLFTLLFLAFFSFLMLKISLSAEIENIGLIIISVVSCFVGGFFCGKKNRPIHKVKRKCKICIRKFLLDRRTNILYNIRKYVLFLQEGYQWIKVTE